MRTVELIGVELAAAGIRRSYGLPGGGSNIDLMAATATAGMDFVLTHSEGAAAFMAAAEGELTGRPGVCMATLGPGAASMANGMAHALLDRAPTLLFTDRYDDAVRARSQHQTIDHEALLRPVTKWSTVLTAATAQLTLREALRVSATAPAGPVHLDLATSVGEGEAIRQAMEEPKLGRGNGIDSPALAAAKTALQNSRRPVLLVGLAARDEATVRAVRRFAERFGLPVLSTYKAKGVFPEGHELAAGILTNAAIEEIVLSRSDGMLTVGLDPVELLPRPWRWSVPLVAVTPTPLDWRQVAPSVELSGEPGLWLSALAEELARGGFAKGWQLGEPAEARREMERRLMVEAEGGLAPWQVVRSAREAAPAATIATVDAGCHMFPATTFWSADEPRRFLISNGLSTMGFGLPAAIAASLATPEQAVICFTGDGGLSINVAELETAARTKSRVVVIVFNDRALSLIKVKQQLKADTPRGVDFAEIDWVRVAEGFGVTARRAETSAALEGALADALSAEGPFLIDVPIDAATYGETVRAIRG